MKKFYVLERRVKKDRRKSPRQYLDTAMTDRRKKQGTPPIVALADLAEPFATSGLRLSTH